MNRFNQPIIRLSSTCWLLSVRLLLRSLLLLAGEYLVTSKVTTGFCIACDQPQLPLAQDLVTGLFPSLG